MGKRKICGQPIGYSDRMGHEAGQALGALSRRDQRWTIVLFCWCVLLFELLNDPVVGFARIMFIRGRISQLQGD